MSESDDFLKRWSRRKREAAQHAAIPAKETDSGDGESAIASEDAAGSGSSAHLPLPDNGKTILPFDLSKLPSLDAIGPATDIRMFMQPGVPAALTRAALRRAWSADPAIRDYIGLSENAWDFTAPDSMAGFGSLDPKEVAQLLANVFGVNKPNEDQTAAAATEENPSAEAETSSGFSSESVADSNARSAKEGGPPQTATDSPVEEPSEERLPDDIAPQNNYVASQKPTVIFDNDIAPLRSPHGRALPQ